MVNLVFMFMFVRLSMQLCSAFLALNYRMITYVSANFKDSKLFGHS